MMSPNLFPTTKRLCSEVPLVKPGALVALLQQYAGEPPEFEAIREWLKPESYEAEAGIHVLPVRGVLAANPHPIELLMGFEDTNALSEEFVKLAEDPGVRAIVLDVDSPGGFVTGGPEFADEVRLAARKKPVCAHTSGDMCSLAYWIGSQASRVTATRSASVGSIGVYSAFVDYTRMLEAAGIKVEVFTNAQGTLKAAGYPGTSLSDEQRHEIQMGVEETFQEFREAVLAQRKGIADESMKGQVFSGRTAATLGLVDGEDSLEGVIADLKRTVPATIDDE